MLDIFPNLFMAITGGDVYQMLHSLIRRCVEVAILIFFDQDNIF